MKWKMPWYFYIFPFLLVGVIVLFWKVTHIYSKKEGPGDGAAQAAIVPGPHDSQKKSTRNESEEDDLRRKDYIKWITPRISGQPWTAPAYDKLQVQAMPEIYCIASEEGHCICHTEQGTRYPIDVKVCRKMVADGVYNPFRRPIDMRDQRSRGQVSNSEQPQRVSGESSSRSVRTDQYKAGVGADSYVPPELTKVTDIGT
jgi:hypothetical protein